MRIVVFQSVLDRRLFEIARPLPAAEPVFRLGRRLVGSVAFSSATRSPRDNHVRSAAAVRKPRGEMYTNPLSGLPVKSIGRTCRLRTTALNSSSGTRTIRSRPTIPQHIRPRYRKARPPNILRSVMSFRMPNAWRIRFASCSSYAIGILKLTVRHLLPVMARVEFHEAHVVLYGHGAEDGRSHPLAV